mgnify:CR=1 FL=1
MKALIAALALLATPATAQEVVECDWRATAAALAEPWEDNSATFANGAVRIALLDTIDPAAGALHLLVLSPPFNELGDRQCRVVSHGQGVGFAGLYFSELEAGYDPAKGLTFSVPVQIYLPEESFSNGGQLHIALNQSTGAIAVDLELGNE